MTQSVFAMAELGLSSRLLHSLMHQYDPFYVEKMLTPLPGFVRVSFSICKISSLDKQISTLKHFFSKSIHDSFKFSSSKRSGIVGILLLCDTNWLD